MRKSKYDTHVKPFLSAIFWWKSEGKTQDEICKRLQISNKSFENYAKQHKELKIVYDYSNANQYGELVKKAYDIAMEGNPTMIMFLLKTKCGFKETSVLETKQEIVNEYDKLDIKTLKEIANVKG